MKILKAKSIIDPKGLLSIEIPTTLQPGPVDVVMVIQEPNTDVSPSPQKPDFSQLAGKLEWQGDALAEQKKLRDEWN